ncbi:FKBP-type peptidyl-prolyl cis-trans isomerase [Terracidiphilus gabretensis]|uniref:FKBP-type peptidyl-prolyl cis-trans isomerase n=1 Tax=Terracidiphilus gabretensis TaxID=1577687 RepID=UPI00071B0D71|nr:FKBP-type peptidyl-prolyl cis-trans isomerase [Terracidiphilus gabretensis]
MKSSFSLLVTAAAFAAILPAQAPTASKPAAPAAHASTTSTAAAGAIKLPPGVPPARGIVKTALALKYQDTKLGTGPLGQDKQIWHVKYTGWRAADGVKFDAWDDHPQPALGPDGKPVMGPDGKPKMGAAQPMEFPHGVGRMIPGFDLAIEGMHVGGKRRIFIPWALAYGYRAIPDRGAEHPGIPAKSDLIFDVELVGVSEIPAPPPSPMPRPGGMMPGAPGAAPRPGQPGTPGQPPAAGQPSAPATTPGSAPATAPTTTTPPPATTTPAPQPKPTTPPPGQ